MHIRDINSDTSLHYTFEVRGGDFAKAGDASSKVKRILQQIGVVPDVVRRVSVACYEAEMNVVIHARQGKVILDADLERIVVVVKDDGPGIDDIEQAMMPGFSTAPDSIREMGFGAGMGLPNMKSCCDNLSIQSVKGVGTTVEMVFDNA